MRMMLFLSAVTDEVHCTNYRHKDRVWKRTDMIMIIIKIMIFMVWIIMCVCLSTHVF